MQPADVASFKPLKNAWKFADLEFRRNNLQIIENVQEFQDRKKFQKRS